MSAAFSKLIKNKSSHSFAMGKPCPKAKAHAKTKAKVKKGLPKVPLTKGKHKAGAKSKPLPKGKAKRAKGIGQSQKSKIIQRKVGEPRVHDPQRKGHSSM